MTNFLAPYAPSAAKDQSDLIEYRSARFSDLDQLRQRLLEIFSVDAWDRDTLSRYLGNRNSRWMIATRGDEIIGWVCYVIESGNTILVSNLAVVSSHRRRGIGRALLGWVIAESLKLPSYKVYLEVSEDSSAAIALYQSSGFATVKKLPGFYVQSDGIEMVLG